MIVKKNEWKINGEKIDSTLTKANGWAHTLPETYYARKIQQLCGWLSIKNRVIF